MFTRCSSLLLLLVILSDVRVLAAAELEAGVRGVATRAPQKVVIDGDLSEFKTAFCTPVEYFNSNLTNRPAQFFYMWDDEAFYAGLRTLDEKQANHAPDDRLWEGDAVEWYFDTRRNNDFRGTSWGPGAVHCYWTGYEGDKVEPRFCLRPGFLDAIPKVGVEVAARKTKHGAEVEFKLPWANFPEFKAKENEVIAIDAELCYSDGGKRVDRTFAFGSPLSVQQPASLAKIQLVGELQDAHWKQCGQVLMPIRVDTAWSQKEKGQVGAQIALPPNQLEKIGQIVFRLTDLEGKKIDEFQAERETFQNAGNFVRANAHWPLDEAAPGAYHVTAIVHDVNGKELARVAPRLVSVGMQQGY